MSKSIPSVSIKPNEEKRILRGHYWIFRNELSQKYNLEDGEIVDIYTSNNKFLCRGFFQSTGNIFARVLSIHQETIDSSFFEKRLKIALELRKYLFKNSKVYRWVHAESDGLPGLVIDRYDSVAVIETNLCFYKKHIHEIATALKNFDDIQYILYKTDESLFKDTPDEVECEINGFKVIVPLKIGQKTGLFLDQRLNYLYSEKYLQNGDILDCFCYTGLWTLHAIRAGANTVTSVDSSEEAIQIGKRNVELNGFQKKVTLVKNEVENILADREEYNVVILDPPAYVKKKDDIKKAFGKYQKLNTFAIQKIKRGGFLITCSCSHFISPNDFREIIKRAVRTASRKAKLLEFHGASPDHPELLMMPELSYLKCAVLQIF